MYPHPFVREAGAGPAVVCVHSSSSNSSQWRALMDCLSPAFHVLAADSFSSGKSPSWAGNRPFQLEDEVALLEPVFAQAGDGFALVGHSYGAAVALKAAVALPGRVRSLALYEPTLFSLIDAQSSPPNDADGIRNAAAAAVMALGNNDLSEAARCIVDFWSGEGTWDRTPEQIRKPIMQSMTNAPYWTNAMFQDSTSLEEFSGLGIPVLYMIGKDSPAASRGVANLLTKTLPMVSVVEFEGMGHMGPISHPGVINDVIRRFLNAARDVRPVPDVPVDPGQLGEGHVPIGTARP